MSFRRQRVGSGALFSLLVLCRASAGQPQGPSAREATTIESAAGRDAASAQATPAPPSPPILKAHGEAVYPAEALRQRVEGQVALELVVDETGRVVAAEVVSPAGHGFDEAAAEAARSFLFEPARQAGRAIRSRVQFSYEFHLPPEPAPVPVAAAPAASANAAPVLAAGARAAPEPTQVGPDQSTLVLASRPLSAASSFSVRDRDFQLRPIGSVQDILRVTPGLVLVQHSGGGKANQYFLRGFDADHGTDLALSIDGVPINMVSHAHGQGFSDTNFIIPEVVQRVEISKGPYFTAQGDFATAGAVNMVSRDDFEHSSVALGVSGSPGHGTPGFRGLFVGSAHFESGLKATFAAELGRQNGPFDHPENWDKYKLFNKLVYPITPSSSITVGELSYAGVWHGSGQIPARAVERGEVSRFGSIDPDEGGYTSRHHVFAQYRLRPSEQSELKALAYLGAYRFNLFSNFTLALRDPERGDEIEQRDRRTFYGARVSYRVVRELENVRFDTSFGADVRNDDIREELWNTAARRPLLQVSGDDVHQTMIGSYANEEITPASWLRLNLGARADMLAFAVDNRRVAAGDSRTGGVSSAQQLSPKASVVLALSQTRKAAVDLYLNYGHGFHSNDVRGAFSLPAVTPLTRAVGEELGLRARLFGRCDLAAALWQLDLAEETVWNGDEGTTEVGRATRRRGVEIELRNELLTWLALDLDLTFTQARFTADGGHGDGLALAPKRTYSGGLSARHPLGPGLVRGGLRFYGISDRPANDDGSLVAEGFTLFDLHAGYRLGRFDFAFDVENLFNQRSRSAQFATTSRLPSEPLPGAALPTGFNCGSAGRLAQGGLPGAFNGCEDVHFTPQYPFTLHVLATVYLD